MSNLSIARKSMYEAYASGLADKISASSLTVLLTEGASKCLGTLGSLGCPVGTLACIGSFGGDDSSRSAKDSDSDKG